MKLEMNPGSVKPLLNERGEPVAHAIAQVGGSLLAQVGGVTLGHPVEEGSLLVFDHDFPSVALEALLASAMFPAAAKARLEARVWPDGRPELPIP